MRRALGCLAVLACGLPLVALAQAVAVAVDDSGSWVESLQRPVLRRGPHGALLAVHQARVRLVLNTAPWLGQQVRIYARAAAPTAVPGVLRWQTAGTTLPGSLAVGERRLIFAGRVGSPYIRDTLDASVELDARLATEPMQLRCSYELELAS